MFDSGRSYFLGRSHIRLAPTSDLAISYSYNVWRNFARLSFDISLSKN